MTTQKKEKTLKEQLSYNHNNLELASVAQEYFKQGEAGLPYAKKSLELILKDIKFSDPWIVKTLTDPQVLKKTIENQLDTYHRARQDETIGEFFDYHKNNFEKYLGENHAAEKELKPFMKENYGKILNEYGKAEHILKGKEEHGIGSDQEVEAAKKIMEKYQNLLITINLLKKRKFLEFKNRVEDEATKDAFKEIYHEKKEKEGGEER